MLTIDVVIPVKDRSTIERCVSTLRDCFSQVSGIQLRRILVCDGGSLAKDCLSQLATICQYSTVDILHRPHQGFNKGWLLNQGLQAAKASVVLVSDADILWSAAAIESMVGVVKSEARRVCCVEIVKELKPSRRVLQTTKYAYKLKLAQDRRLVEIYPTAVDLDFRSGCGLLCARRSLFLEVGGYRHSFEHWGWEDQDFLIRAQLLGYQRVERGGVVHLSHGNDLRNLPVGGSIEESRDRNIRICLAGLAKGQLRGDLQSSYENDRSIALNSDPEAKPIQVCYRTYASF